MVEEHIPPTQVKSIGKRHTQQRQAILEYLLNTTEHPSADQIYRHLRERFASLSLATVYNTLELLVSSGQITAIGDIGDHKERFDGNTTDHINLVCSVCHKITDLPFEQFETIDEQIQEQSDFLITGSRILYFGVCPECQIEQKSSSTNK
ncbi:MAG: transcriptional repressor [Anaerolineaceae bacterium]